jgi:ABC-type multidrug transport system fused ATPase/permease subunit
MDEPVGGVAPSSGDPAPPPVTVPERAFGPKRALALVRSAARPAALFTFVGLALLAGFMEAGVLLVVVAIAASLADGRDAIDVSFGPLDTSFTTAEAVLLGFALTAMLVACSLPAAWVEARMAARYLASIRRRLFRALTAASWREQSGVIEARLQDLAGIGGFKVGGLLLILTTVATNGLGLLALTSAALALDPLTAGSLLLVVVVLAVVFRPMVLGIRRRSQVHVEHHGHYVERLADAYGVLVETRVFGVRDEAASIVDQENVRTADSYRQMMFRGRVIPSLYLGATAGLLLLGLAVASIQDDLAMAKVGAIVLFLLRALRYSQQVQAGWQSAMEQVPYLERIEAALEEWAPDPGEFGDRALERVGVIEFRDAGYTYPTGQVGIEHLTLTIRPGEIVGLEGPSGAGKSTIAQLVLGLRRPTTGRYLVDGVRAEAFEERSWYARFAYVAQEPRLIRGDIKDNVRFLRPDVTDDDVASALEEAGIGRDLLAWSSGSGRQVGSGGRELSGGQRQRIAIARALAGHPDVLVLDEPTSALDRESEEIVRSTIAALRGKVTVVLVAHRESTLAVCDRIITVDRHRATERTLAATAEG